MFGISISYISEVLKSHLDKPAYYDIKQLQFKFCYDEAVLLFECPMVSIQSKLKHLAFIRMLCKYFPFLYVIQRNKYEFTPLSVTSLNATARELINDGDAHSNKGSTVHATKSETVLPQPSSQTF